jgi:uncharacterized protein (DUF2267 family)
MALDYTAFLHTVADAARIGRDEPGRATRATLRTMDDLAAQLSRDIRRLLPAGEAMA